MDCVPLQLFLLNIMSIKTNVNVASNNEILISCKMKETLSRIIISERFTTPADEHKR